jgi:PAS domain S-box-containing protein
VDPARLRRDPGPPPIAIEEALVDGKASPTGSRLLVPPGRMRLELRYAVLSFRAPSRVAIRFRLEGFDEDWVDAGERRRADYTGVPPGDYSFRVSARSPGGTWSVPGAVLPVRVEPRFTQTRAFAALLVLSAATLLAGGWTLRARRLQKRERELTTLVAQRTEELRRQSAYLASLHETALGLMNRLEVETLLEALVARATVLLETPDGFLYLETPDRTHLQCRVSVGSLPRDLEAAPNEGAVGHAWAGGVPVAIDDYDSWPGRSPQVPFGTFGPMLAVPLGSGDRFTGALGVALGAGNPRRFVPAEISLLSAFGQLASIAIDNARLFESATTELEERRRAQDALAESEHRFRQLAENIDAVFSMRSLEPPRMLYVSPAYERLWGRSPEPLYDDPQKLLDTVHPEDRAAFAEALASRDGYEIEYRILRPDGTARVVTTRGFPVRGAGGAVESIAAISEDVTARKQAEDLRENLTRTIVHDLKNPLTSVLVSVEFLLDNGDPSPGHRRVLEIARTNTKRLVTMVGTILDVSRLEAGVLPLELERVEIEPLVAEVLELQRPLAAPRELALSSVVPVSLPAAWADRALVTRVLENLVGNAIKFTPKNGHVEVSAEADVLNACLRVRVRDTGPGIPEEMRGRLFQKFATGKQPGSGSGLGLSFCRLAVEAQGGRIASEECAKGAAFTFTLPLAASD